MKRRRTPLTATSISASTRAHSWHEILPFLSSFFSYRQASQVLSLSSLSLLLLSLLRFLFSLFLALKERTVHLLFGEQERKERERDKTGTSSLSHKMCKTSSRTETLEKITSSSLALSFPLFLSFSSFFSLSFFPSLVFYPPWLRSPDDDARKKERKRRDLPAAQPEADTEVWKNIESVCS